MNKFLANIGLFTICVTGAVLLLLFYRVGNGLFGLPSQETTTTRRIVKPTDLRTLNPEIKQALEIARTTALDHARSLFSSMTGDLSRSKFIQLKYLRYRGTARKAPYSCGYSMSGLCIEGASLSLIPGGFSRRNEAASREDPKGE